MLNLLSYLRMGGNFALAAILLIVLRLPIVFFSLSIHESSHGYAAYKLGDPTARNLGRITLDPLKHFDPIGTVCLLIFGIGWAKPVPINSRYFKKPKRDIALTAAAGPLSNLVAGFGGIIVLRILDLIAFSGQYFVSASNSVFQGYMYNGSLSDYAFSFIFETEISMTVRLLFVLMLFLEMLAMMNIALALFNLIPIPPFDGSRIAFAILPNKIYFGVMKYERYIMIAFIVLFYFFGGGLSSAASAVFDGIYKLISLITPFA